MLVDIADGHGASPAQVALAWLLGRPAVASLIIGARTDEQLRDNLGAADLVLTAADRAALDQVSAPELVYPHWHQLATARTALGPADLALLGQHLKGRLALQGRLAPGRGAGRLARFHHSDSGRRHRDEQAPGAREGRRDVDLLADDR